MDDLKNRLFNVITQQLSTDSKTLRLDTLIVDLGADSLDWVELIMMIEDEFKISLGESEVDQITTVQHLFDLVQKKSTS